MKILLALIFFWLTFPTYASITIADDAHHTITLEKPASRVISLAPHLTEILFDLGAGSSIVGVDSASDYPRAAKKIPQVGNYLSINAEKILSLHPDLIVLWQSGSNHSLEQELNSLGIPLYISQPKKIDDIAKTMQDLARLTQTPATAQAVIEKFQTELQELRSQFQTQEKLSVFYEIWLSPLMTINQDSLINEVIDMCGGENIFAAAKVLTPTVDIEAILARNPAVIIGDDQMSAWRITWQAWPQLTAVKNHTIYSIDANLLQRFTPRLLQGAQQLCSNLAQARKL